MKDNGLNIKKENNKLIYTREIEFNNETLTNHIFSLNAKKQNLLKMLKEVEDELQLLEE